MNLQNKFLSDYRTDVVAVCLLFLLALGVRLLYQEESIVYHPVRADASRYFVAAYNLKNLGTYSLDKSTPYGMFSEKATDLPPGYPLFLSLFMDGTETVERVLIAQAVMGTLTSVITFLLARLVLNLRWALMAGFMTALSPHLVAMNGYLLSETLFTFIMMLGSLVLTISWKNNRYFLTLIASALLVFSGYIRYLNILFLFSMIPLFFLNPYKNSLLPKSIWMKQLVCLFFGFIIILFAHNQFERMTVDGGLKSSFNNIESPLENGSGKKDILDKILHVVRPEKIQYIVRPPEFFVRGESHVGFSRYNSELPTEISFKDNPFVFLKWYFGGRLSLMWHWDNAYNGDVYIYPMLRKGFEENILLKCIHRVFRFMHWPFFWLALTGPVFLFVQWRMKGLSVKHKLLLPVVLGFIYLITGLYITAWLPRYTIPVRPFSYILAVFSMSWILSYIKERCFKCGPKGK